MKMEVRNNDDQQNCHIDLFSSSLFFLLSGLWASVRSCVCKVLLSPSLSDDCTYKGGSKIYWNICSKCSSQKIFYPFIFHKESLFIHFSVNNCAPRLLAFIKKSLPCHLISHIMILNFPEKLTTALEMKILI